MGCSCFSNSNRWPVIGHVLLSSIYWLNNINAGERVLKSLLYMNSVNKPVGYANVWAPGVLSLAGDVKCDRAVVG